MKDPILVSNSFPFSLIRRRVTAEPREIEELRETLRTRPWASFWGHTNTLEAAGAMAGVDLSPKTARPAISLNEEGLPTLDGMIFRECWLLSPYYVPGFRPSPGEEVTAKNILGWQVLRMEWEQR
ncbi:MAG: hypothetical protein ACAI35_03955 [Candidatus Methylacidiphilales bacterium]|nr:hypothetical protein [Candidatus Methylacidiphilales bacterium]